MFSKIKIIFFFSLEVSFWSQCYNVFIFDEEAE
jgi:hypothetical protein